MTDAMISKPPTDAELDVTADKAKSAAGDTIDKAQDAVEKAKSVGSDAFEKAKAVGSDALQSASDRTVELRKALEERATAAREWATDQTDVIRDTVQTKPFIAVGVSAASAFAAGLIIGVLLARD